MLCSNQLSYAATKGGKTGCGILESRPVVVKAIGTRAFGQSLGGEDPANGTAP